MEAQEPLQIHEHQDPYQRAICRCLQSADMDGDGDIDFAEWRKELKARGYSDLEIETVFAKYDQDGDKVTGI